MMDGKPVSQCLFESVANRDYESLVRLFGANARDSIISFLSMRSRWTAHHSSSTTRCHRGDASRAEEKLDEFLQQLAYQQEPPRGEKAMKRAPVRRDDPSYYALLRELAVFLTEREGVAERQSAPDVASPKKKNIEISADAERLLRDASAVLSDTRPPANFVVYDDGMVVAAQDRDDALGPPIFDGSVANATPPPLGGATGPAGGAGTILHLACALDVPLALAFLLAMGADARASHTAFRRLMIHEAACNGSINCMTLLLELGEQLGDMDGNAGQYVAAASAEMKQHAMTPPVSSPSSAVDLPFLPRRMDRMQAVSPLQLYSRQPEMFRSGFEMEQEKLSMDYMSLLRLFRKLAAQVQQGIVSELDAAREILKNATFQDTSKVSIIRSCTFIPTELPTTRTFMRSNYGHSDGHGNTPLHWAAFKNETECVGLLLRYNADANARAHPSGWTPLHDAAYSNSKESIALLLDAGAQVDARANSGATPLCFAAQEDAAEAARLLLERGADLWTRCAGGPVRDDGTVQPNGPHSRFSGYTPLHYCAHYNAHKAARVLLEHPAAKQAMEIADLSDRLPIHVAVARGSSDVLRELLHAGARVETRNVQRSSSTASRNSSFSRSGSAMSTASVSSSTTNASGTTNSSRTTNSSGSSSARHRRFGGGVRQRATSSGHVPSTPRRSPPFPESPMSSPGRPSPSATPVSSPLLRSMIPSQPVTSSKPWNCLTQRSIDECRQLISESEQHWCPERHSLFTPADRRAVWELLRVGKRLEQNGTGIFIDLWPQVLSFCGRGWFEVEDKAHAEESSSSMSEDGEESMHITDYSQDDSLSLPTF